MSREKKEPELRYCAVCGKEFTTTVHNKKYCSELCGKKAWKKQEEERIKRKKMMQVAKICEECGKVFWIDAKSTAHFCSQACIDKMTRKKANSKKKCIVCGESFDANNKCTKMCSAECIRKRQYQLQSNYKSRPKKVTISENTLAIAEKNEKARALGLSYGQYDMMLYLKSLETEKMGRSIHE